MLKAFLLAGAVMLTWQEATQQVLRGRWCSYALALLAILCVLFSPVLIWLGDALGGFLLYALLGTLWLIGLRRLATQISEMPIWDTLTAVLIGLTLGIAFFFIINTKGYASIFAPEQTLLGLQDRNTLYHDSLAAMLAKFGVPSTGLDGLPLERFHFLSHAWVGLTGRWMHVAPVHAYYLTQQIVGIPLLFFSLSTAAYWMWRPERLNPSAAIIVAIPIALVVLFQGWDWARYLTSGEYCLSLILLLLTLPLLTELAERPQIACGRARYIALGVALMGMLYAKTLVGVIFSAGLFYSLIRRGGLTPLNILKYATPIGIIVCLAVTTTVQPSGVSPSSIDPLHFLLTYPDAAWPNIIATALGLAAAAVLWTMEKNPQRLVIETLIVLMLVGIAFGLLLRVPSGSAYFFFNVGVWIAIVFAAGAVLYPALGALDRPSTSAAAILIVFLALLSDAHFRNGSSKLLSLLNGLGQDQQPQLRLSPVTASWMSLFDPYDPFRALIADRVGHKVGGQLKQALIEAGLPGSRDTVVFVPPRNTAFWKLQHECTAQPFFVPATVSAPMINGLQPQGECPTPQDGWFGYGPYSESSRSQPLSDTELCEKAVWLGFARVAIIDSPEQVRALNCK